MLRAAKHSAPSGYGWIGSPQEYRSAARFLTSVAALEIRLRARFYNKASGLPA
jgi:hypothetical protein